MSDENFDPGIYDLYARTTYTVRDESGQEVFFNLKSAKELPLLRRKQFAVVTAWNPMNRRLSAHENEVRNEQLESELQKTPYVFYPTIGVLGEHFEKSFTVEKIPESEAVRMGSLFEQYAILINDSLGCRLVRCPPKSV